VHVVRLRNVYKVFVGKPQGKRPHVRPRHRWEDNIRMELRLDDGMIGFRFPAGAGNFALRYRVQTGSGTHPASFPMGTWGSFPGGEADHLPPSSAEVECV
jgi:hypothetical protein